MSKSVKPSAPVPEIYPGDVHVFYRRKPADWPRSTRWDGWAVGVVTGDVTSIQRTDRTQAIAWRAAVEIAKFRKVECVMHAKASGKIVRKDSYGRDSRASKG